MKSQLHSDRGSDLEDKDQDPVSLMAQGKEQFRARNYKAAIALYTNAIELGFTIDDTFFRKGLCQKAIAECYKSMADLPNITSDARNENLKKAITYYKKARQCFKCNEPSSIPTEPDKQYYLAYENLNPVSKPSKLNRLHYLEEVNSKLKSLYEHRGNIEKAYFYTHEAVKAYDKICQCFPENLRLQSELAKKNDGLIQLNFKISEDFRNKQNLKKAIIYANNACGIAMNVADNYPDNVEYEKQYAEKLIYAAELYEANKNMSDAIICYKQAQEIYTALLMSIESNRLEPIIKRLSSILEHRGNAQTASPDSKMANLHLPLSEDKQTFLTPKTTSILHTIREDNKKNIDRSTSRSSFLKGDFSPHISASVFNPQSRRYSNISAPMEIPPISEECGSLELDSPVASQDSSKKQNGR